MGLPSDERNFLRSTFAGAFSYTPPKVVGHPSDPTVAIVDFMQHVKVMPTDIITKDGMIEYFVNKIKYLLLRKGSTIRTVIVLVDGRPIPVKRMVEHKKRYKDSNVYSAKKGPYLPKEGCDLIPTEWIRFAGNYKLLRRELYPLLFNALLSCKYFTPHAGQTIILSGFPGRSEWINTNDNRAWDAPENHEGKVLTVTMWDPAELPISKAAEKADPDLYHRTYVLEHIAPCPEFPNGGVIRRTEWKEAKNDISEADIRMFYFDHWFAGEHICFYLNDGDIFSIGLLYAYERLHGINRNGVYEFRNAHTVRMPYKKKTGNEFFAGGEVPSEEYVDLNKMFELVREYHVMNKAGVQNPVATLVFLLIIAGSDFFQDFLKGMGTQTVIWKVFFDNIDVFTHMVQLSEGVTPDTRTKRVVVVDEDLFIQFCRWCMLEKYEKTELKRLKTDKLTYDQLRRRTKLDGSGKPKEDTGYHLPDRNGMRLWARQVEWNMDYWKNGPLGFVPDAFETWHGVPYYPYAMDVVTKKPIMIDVVASRQKPRDHVYEQHMYRYKIRNKKRPRAEDVESAQQEVIARWEKGSQPQAQPAADSL